VQDAWTSYIAVGKVMIHLLRSGSLQHGPE
jgi:hypothetical protein